MSNEAVSVKPPITKPMVGKRKGSVDFDGVIGEGAPTKKRPKKSGNSKEEPDTNWPEYFRNVNITVSWLQLCRLTRLHAAIHCNGLAIVFTNPSFDKPLRYLRVSIR